MIDQRKEMQEKVGPKAYVGPQWIKGISKGSFRHSFIQLFSSFHFDRACLSRGAKSAVLFNTRYPQEEISTSTLGDFECPLRRGVPPFFEGIFYQQHQQEA